jgi:hypothetical protein
MVFTGGSDGYEEKNTKDREEAFVAEDPVRPAGEERSSLFNNGTYAEDSGLPCNLHTSPFRARCVIRSWWLNSGFNTLRQTDCEKTVDTILGLFRNFGF